MIDPWLTGNSLISPGSVVLRLGIAALIGGIIGWDRQRHDKPAGLRTHMLVTLGSATFVLLGFEVGAEMAHRYGAGIDPTRVLQGVVGGIGFLGAGSIIKGDGQVSGVTTAASVWVSGALGAAAGMGAYFVSLVATLFTIATLALIGRFEPNAGSRVRNVPPSQNEPGGADSNAGNAPPGSLS